MYHVDLELADEQVRELKQLAFDRNQSVRGLVTELAIREIQKNKESKSPESKNEK